MACLIFYFLQDYKEKEYVPPSPKDANVELKLPSLTLFAE